VIRLMAGFGRELGGKMLEVAQVEIHQEKEAKRLVEAHKLAGTAAALEYLKRRDAGKQTSREELAKMFGTSTKAMRVAQQRIENPDEACVPGRPAAFRDDDFVRIGLMIISAAVSGHCLPWIRVRGLFLLARNTRLEIAGGQRTPHLSNSMWTRARNYLMYLWERLGTPIVNKQRTATLEQKRLDAEVLAVKPFFGLVQAIAEQFPEYAEAVRKLNGDESPGARQPNETTRTSVASVPSIAVPTAAKDGPCPKSFTIWTTSLASGEIGPTGIIQEGDKPLVSNWFAGQLPIGISKDWINDPMNVFFAYNGTSDRMRFDTFLDILTNSTLPFHRKHVPDGPLFW
jgi:hypothetical protein